MAINMILMVRFLWNHLQSSRKWFVRGLVKFVPALAYLFCLTLPGCCLANHAYLFQGLCTELPWFVRGSEKFVPALAYLFCLSLPGSCLARFTNLLWDLCIARVTVLIIPKDATLKGCLYSYFLSSTFNAESSADSSVVFFY